MKAKKNLCGCNCGERAEFVETKNVSLKGYTLLEGFPGLGLAGTIGAKYIVEKLKFEQIGYVDSNHFAPVVRIESGVPMHPVRIYASKKNKLVVILSEQIIQKEMMAPIARALVEWIKNKGIKRVISTSGIKTEEPTKVYAFASNEASKKTIKKGEIKIIKNGITSGVTALIMLYLKDNNIDAFCILGNTKTSTDYNAAVELIKTISKLTNLKIDVEPLSREAKVVRESLVEHIKMAEEKSGSGDDQAPMYI
ncbi:MAG: PAC2 family protein [Candidatus Diapherotrites archaeon]|nr:PAC2 family protein [Candidatus Diapherotrites archaeon]